MATEMPQFNRGKAARKIGPGQQDPRLRLYGFMLRTNGSGQEIGIRGRMSAGLCSGKP